MQVNGEVIYATRPLTVFGEGAHQAKGGAFAGQSTGALDAQEVRFTRNKRNDTVYAIILGWPEGESFVVKSLGAGSSAHPGKVEKVELLDCNQKLLWTQSDESLTVQKAAAKPCQFAYALKVSMT